MDAQKRTRSVQRERVNSDNSNKNKTPKGARQICLPMTREQYDDIWQDAVKVRNWLDGLMISCPEIFPPAAREHYQLCGLLSESKKMPGIRLRQLRTGEIAYTIRPSFVFAYMTGTVEELEHPLLLLSVRTPVWVVTKIFGHNDMFWQRHLERMGRNSLVGTTVRDPERMPEHIAADEHHLKWQDDKGFLAMVAAGGCILGAALTDKADEEHLTAAYQVFAQEAADVDADWQPQTASTDGWKATRNSLRGLFSRIVLVLCFLHGFLKVRDRSRKDHDLHQKVWDVYRAESADDFRTRMAALQTWSQTQNLKAPVQTALEKLFSHVDDYALSYAHPDCYRTSNQVDRPMNRIKRSLYASRGLHGHQASSERRLRGLCLLENFRPFAPRSNIPRKHCSPAVRLSHKCYENQWLHNLQISASLQGFHSRT
jgi:hypothetical protein